jgi:hypothetical protein
MLWETECRSQVVSISGSFSGGPGSNLGPAVDYPDSIVAVFLSPFK